MENNAQIYPKLNKKLILKTDHFQKINQHIESSFVNRLGEQMRYIIIRADLF